MKFPSCKKNVDFDKKTVFTIQIVDGDTESPRNYRAVSCQKCNKIHADRMVEYDIKYCDACGNLPEGKMFEKYKVISGVLDPSKDKRYPRGAAFEGLRCPRCGRLTITKHLIGVDVSKQLSGK